MVSDKLVPVEFSRTDQRRDAQIRFSPVEKEENMEVRNLKDERTDMELREVKGLEETAGQFVELRKTESLESPAESGPIKRKGDFVMIKGGKGHTIADIEALPNGKRAELIDGEMFMMAPPMTVHQRILIRLAVKISLYITEKNGKCEVLPAPFGVYIKKDNSHYVEPDISVICDREKLDERGCQGAPDWVIEILSPSSVTMDCERKVKLYREAGVREYWIVDPEEEAVTVYEFGRAETSGETDPHAEDRFMPLHHTFSERIKAGIFEDLWLDFSEMDLG